MFSGELIDSLWSNWATAYDKKLIDSILHHWPANEKSRYYSSPQWVSLFQISKH